MGLSDVSGGCEVQERCAGEKSYAADTRVMLEESAREALRNPDSYPEVIFDDHHFLITRRDLDRLLVYDTSKPTGVYHGKCWKYRILDAKQVMLEATGSGEKWGVGCYVYDGNPDGLLTPYRTALIVEDAA